MVKGIRVCFACRAQDEKFSVYHGNEKVNNNFEKSLHQEIVGKFEFNANKDIHVGGLMTISMHFN